jgi:hypothetical protein
MQQWLPGIRRRRGQMEILDLKTGIEGVPISGLVEMRHRLTALIEQNLYGAGSRPEGRAALIARNHLDDFVFRITNDDIAKGDVADLVPLKQAIILETYTELLKFLTTILAVSVAAGKQQNKEWWPSFLIPTCSVDSTRTIRPRFKQ